MNLQLRLISIIIFGCLCLCQSTQAAIVDKTRGKKILISIDGDNIQTGDKLPLYIQRGRKKKIKGLVKIQKINSDGTLAIGTLIKGKARKGYKVKSRRKRSKKSNRNSKKKGFILGYATNSLSISPSGADETVDMTGSGFSTKFFYDYPLFSKIQIRAMAGLEQFNVTGTANNAICDSSKNCSSNITYGTLDGIGQFYFAPKFWLGAGMSIYIPATSESNAVKSNSIKITSIQTLAGGYDIRLGSGRMLPIQIEYALFPSSDTAKATSIILRLGYQF